MPEEKLIGKVTHIYGKIGVAIIKLSAPLSVGQSVRFRGAHDDFNQTISDMQYDHQAISQGAAGQEVGVKVEAKVHEGDQVFLVE
ncbi:MAG: hypothetical protein UV57_C0024G0004 [Parcubacteria group bacterium GW2011_GWD2_43_10]|uniref:Translation elongation factor-like protein n=4 Tax=Candidatus Vebleniibacteriota TaxID=1817921 RepID=A0A1G2QCL1_9BACT|nr:MAG: hypothetical protein UV57_C0024G0004 [Parcubacteria group bacterium GW2011_GWD2_43_10]KKS93045.1 MAG: hypothetical protein UV69_C0015G0015 [Parcubacteria group bacterium GW2011_GWE2_43_12]KKT11782.1 MAG: hypothetical protein UV92_C0039G0006 [Parcubacteria group bacterium GW2011_GWA1_43_27]KKT25314.1 MAG: hypothetical protein UW12_C0049G0007 [Parcubacteria group bacterium GW2011_GWF1_43_9]OHA54657.1 MAG: hypothetical protein A2226_01925 [Candidatus Veblenbacteria bacterium RIFOXYA2_FULL_